MTLRSVNPATGDSLQSFVEMTEYEVNAIVESVHGAYRVWRETSFSFRAKRMKEVAHLLRDRKEEFGTLMTEEMGKPINQSKAEAEKCAWVCEYYADNAEKFLANKDIATEATNSFVSYQPIGIVLAVMPWNFPFWQVFRFAAPSLMAGNAGILKHASNVQGCAQAIEDIFTVADFPDNLFKNLVIGSDKVKNVIKNPLIKAVTLTGSTPAGKAVASLSGSMLKKTVLELGGSDPYVILEDADLDQAVNACIAGRMLNTGQSCIAAKRFIVVEPCLAEFTDKVANKIKDMNMGDPLDLTMDIGPMVNVSARDELHQQVIVSLDQGAVLVTGGIIPEPPGSFYPPTLIVNVTPGMPAFDDELFGPVAVVIAAKDEQQALELANQTKFGLGAAVFTADLEKGKKIATEVLEAGSCFVNDFVKSDPRLPFGGIKESGYGRELSEFGIHEFVNIKTVVVQ